MAFEERGTINDVPIWGIAIAISDHYLLTATHAVQWITEQRGAIDPQDTKLLSVPWIYSL